jgi:hypothetical protein
MIEKLEFKYNGKLPSAHDLEILVNTINKVIGWIDRHEKTYPQLPKTSKESKISKEN